MWRRLWDAEVRCHRASMEWMAGSGIHPGMMLAIIAALGLIASAFAMNVIYPQETIKDNFIQALVPSLIFIFFVLVFARTFSLPYAFQKYELEIQEAFRKYQSEVQAIRTETESSFFNRHPEIWQSKKVLRLLDKYLTGKNALNKDGFRSVEEENIWNINIEKEIKDFSQELLSNYRDGKKNLRDRLFEVERILRSEITGTKFWLE